MTLDETTLPAALRDLAAMAPDDPARLACVHRRAARAQRRRRAVGAGAIAATMAATAAGAEALVSSRHGGAPVAAATGGSSSAPPAAPAACPTQPPPGDSRQPLPPTAPSSPPAIGAEFSGGGVISAPGTATSVTVKVDGGPLAGSTLALAVTPSSRVFEAPASPGAQEVAVSSTQLKTGQMAKFTATRTGTASYVLDEIHAGPAPGSDAQAGQVPGSDSQPGPKQSGGAAVATPPGVGDPFKVGGVGVSSTNDSITVNVTQGNLSGVITFALTCRPPQNVAGEEVEVAGTRTGAHTYTAQVLIVNPPPVTPNQPSGAASRP